MVVTIFTLEAEARAVTPCQPPAVLKRSHHMQYRLEARAIRLPMLTWLEARLYDFVFVFLSLFPVRLLVPGSGWVSIETQVNFDLNQKVRGKHLP